MSDQRKPLGWSEHIRREWVLMSCPDCKALVLPEHVHQHRAWHQWHFGREAP
jgi:hypothetical protein